MEQTPILECRNLCISYDTRGGEIPAVIDFNLKVMPGQGVGIVGESGCGKSTVALAIMQYLGSNGYIKSGEIFYHGRDMRTMSEEELRSLRGSKIAMIYQEPMASLNPSMKIGDQLAEVPLFHEDVSRKEALKRAQDLLEAVKLPDPPRIMESYPHQISGGQQQRVVIAMALLSKPDLLLLDEPTTALDVTVERGIVELVKEISAEFGTSMIYISHNLGLILDTCDRVTVMYSGEAVEDGTVKEVFDKMQHPYTTGLFASIPLPGADKNERPLVPIPGQLPLPHQRPQGCFFGPRCAFFRDGPCNGEKVSMRQVEGEDGHTVRCARFEDIDWAEGDHEAVTVKTVKSGKVVLEVKNMKKYYEIADSSIMSMIKRTPPKTVKANENINFNAREAETVAIVGES
ncbi:MAG: oligopeptide/dipeptide ABC transporter ATP-binding protein, partial [Sneathiella sp.]